MNRTILVPVDGSEHSWRAFSHALEYHVGEHILVLNVVNPAVGEFAPETPGGHDRKQSEVITEQAKERFERANHEDTTLEVVVEEGIPRLVILEYLERADVGQVVMGTRGLTGIKRALLGNVTTAVVHRSNVPVNVIPAPGDSE